MQAEGNLKSHLIKQTLKKAIGKPSASFLVLWKNVSKKTRSLFTSKTEKEIIRAIENDFDFIERKIDAIHKSSRTFFPVFQPLHNYLRMKLKWYYKWHLSPHSTKVHFSAATVAVVLIFALLMGLFPHQTRANNYNKIWTSTADFNTGTNSNIDTASNEAKLASTTTAFSEGFTGTTYKDAATDANWDTVNHKLALPGDPANGITTDLQAKWKATVGDAESIRSSAYDSTNHFIYLGGGTGSFVVFNPANSTATNLTSKISANWSTEAVQSMTFDSINAILYLGGYPSKLGAFTGGATPSSGTWAYLTNQLVTPDFDGASYFSSTNVAAMTFDSTNGYIYMGNNTGKIGAVQATSTPNTTTTWTYFATQLVTPDFDNASYWASTQINTMAFDSTNGYIYFGGNTGKLGAVQATATPGNVTAWTYLTTQLATPDFDNGSYWSNLGVSAMAFDATNGFIYIGGINGKFGAVPISATPGSTTTWKYLVSKISGDMGTTAGASDILSMSYDSTAQKIYLTAYSGRFGVYTGGADPANGTWSYQLSNTAASFVGYDILASANDTASGFIYLGGGSGMFAAYKISDGTTVDLTSKISATWGANSILSMTFDSTNSKVYLGGGTGTSPRFGCYTGGSDPASGTWVSLTAKVSALGWSVYNLDAMTFDSTNGKVYFGGAAARFGAFTGGSDPANGTAVYLATKVAGYTIESMSFDTTNGKVYIGGQSSQLGVFTGGADPANASNATYLTTQLANPAFTNASYYGTNDITAMVYDSVNHYMYFGGRNGKMGVLQTAADATTITTWTYLTAQLSTPDFDNASYWSTDYIYSMSYMNGRIFIGGASGKLGTIPCASPPSGTTWSYLTSNISSFWSTNSVKTIVANPSTAIIYAGGVGGKYASYMVGYTSDRNGLSVAIDGTSQNIYKATLTATASTPTNTTITYYLSNDGGSHWNAVTSGVEYTFTTAASDLRWKANMTTTDLSVTPEITGISISYVNFNSNSGTMDLVFDALQAVTPTALSWNSTLPANTTLTFKIRTAATQDALAAATWSDVKNNADTPVNLKTLPVGGVPGVPENRFSEVYLTFTTSDGLGTPVLADMTEQYVINSAPELRNLTASQLTNGSKTVAIAYEVRDPDTDLNPYNQNMLSMSFKYSIDNGSTWHDCVTITNTGLLSVEKVNYTPYTAVWNIATDLPGSHYENTVKIKAIANDNEQAHNTAELVSSAFSTDTINPSTGAITGGFTGIKINDGTSWTNNATVNLTLSASDDNTKRMEIRNDTSFSTNGADAEAYAASKTGYALSAGDGDKTVFVRFYDPFGNYTDASTAVLLDTTPPAQPLNLKVYDTSDKSLERYSLTLIWDSVPAVADFGSYVIDRKIGLDGTYAQLTTSSQTTYTDTNLDKALTYYYRVKAADIHANNSTPSSSVNYQPDSADTSAPQISGPIPSVTPADVTATVVWITNEASDSFVEYGTTAEYGQSQGKVEYVTGHSVILVGLSASTNYYYRVNSTDSHGNRMTGPDQTFTTTWPAESSSAPTITGATAQKPGANPEEVTIIWTTDKYSTSQVLYGQTDALGSQTEEDTTLNKTHYITITKLSPNTKYYYRARSKDSYNNVVLGELKYFVTSNSTSSDQSPTIGGVEVSDITLTTAIISWQTTVVTTSIIEYGTDATYGSRIEDVSLGSTTNHVIRMKDLTQGVKYHFRVLGESPNTGTIAANVDSTFSTLTMPTISDISIKDLSSLSATVTWKTNAPADSFVDFGIDGANMSQGRSEEVTEHAVTLIGLKPATTYQYRIKSRDQYSNQATSEIRSFQTIIDTTAPVISDLKSESSIISDANGNSKAQIIISWSTDEPSTSMVRYAKGVAKSGDYPLSTQEDLNLTTSHVIIISSLEPSVTYHMKVVSKDSSGNIGASDDYTVLTLNQQKSLTQYIIQLLEERFFWVKQFGLF